MNKRQQVDASNDLEKRLEQSAERIAQAIMRPAEISRRIKSIRTGRKVILPVPDEVKRWFEDVEEFQDER